ncbi:hypothetical protein [Amycolatopsis sp. NPDC059657]|uniref:hypothetical protein n=1 Tax=Amycolatopsis sp. NPDC059657 TaxID=3346899 RepID=UPI00366A795C
MTLSTSLTNLSDAELRERLDDALLNLDAPVDAPDNDGVDVEVRDLMGETQRRALLDHAARTPALKPWPAVGRGSTL